MSEELLQYSKCATAIVPIYATTNHAVTAVAVNATGFDRVAFFIQTGEMNASAVLTVGGITESTSSTGTYALKSGTSLTNVTSAGASKVYVIDMPVSGTKPYLKIRATSGTARAYVSALAIMYRGSGIQPDATEGYSQYKRV